LVCSSIHEKLISQLSRLGSRRGVDKAVDCPLVSFFRRLVRCLGFKSTFGKFFFKTKRETELIELPKETVLCIDLLMPLERPFLRSILTGRVIWWRFLPVRLKFWLVSFLGSKSCLLWL